MQVTGGIVLIDLCLGRRSFSIDRACRKPMHSVSELHE